MRTTQRPHCEQHPYRTQLWDAMEACIVVVERHPRRVYTEYRQPEQGQLMVWQPKLYAKTECPVPL